MESLLLKEKRSLIEKGISRQHIKIRNQSLLVHDKVHTKILNYQLFIESPTTNVHKNVASDDPTAQMDQDTPN